MKNSWYILENETHHYFCACGRHDSIEESRRDKEAPYPDMLEFDRENMKFENIPNLFYPDNTCSDCGNQDYIDRDALLFSNGRRHMGALQWGYTQATSTEGWHITATLDIPLYDKASKQYTTGKYSLADFSLLHTGEEKSEIFVENLNKKVLHGRESDTSKKVSIESLIRKSIETQMPKLVKSHPTESIAWLPDEIDDKKALIFFLHHSHIRFADIYYWKHKEFFVRMANSGKSLISLLAHILNHRTEKSLRKAQLISYQEQMETGSYNPVCDYIFAKYIEDRNHLLKLVSLPAAQKLRMFEGVQLEDVGHFMEFLRHFYTEKNQVTFWLHIANGETAGFYLRDTVRFFHEEEVRELLYLHFQKTALQIHAMHNELMQHYNHHKKSRISNKPISFSEGALASETTQDEMSYKLPPNAQELYAWGEILHNCLFSYTKAITTGRSTIFGVFVEDELRYALEIQEDMIIQLSGKYNRTVEEPEREKIEKWFKEVYLRKSVEFFEGL